MKRIRVGEEEGKSQGSEGEGRGRVKGVKEREGKSEGSEGEGGEE